MLRSPNGSLCPSMSICKQHRVWHLQGCFVLFFFYRMHEKGLPLVLRCRAVALPGCHSPCRSAPPLRGRDLAGPLLSPMQTSATPTHQVRHQHGRRKIQFGALASDGSLAYQPCNLAVGLISIN